MTERDGLEVTLVSGLDDADRTRVAEALTGSPRTPPEASEFSVPEAESAEFALDLAEHLCSLACTGPGGHVVITLETEADVVDIGFILDQEFQEKSDDGTRIALRDLVTVTSVRDIRRWLFGEQIEQSLAHDVVTAERLALQLEFATTIVLVDAEAATGTADRSQLAEVRKLLFKMNPRARVVSLGRVATLSRPPEWARRSVTQRLGHSMGWILELAGRVGPSSTRDVIGSLVFRDPRLFHPARLSRAVATDLLPQNSGLIVRSRGIVRLASRPDRVGSWSTAGGVLTLEPTSMSSWDVDSPLGQELVFFGKNLKREAITAALERCLLTPEEFLAGPDRWRDYRDEFPAWAAPLEH